MNRYIGYLLGALFVVPIGALIAKYATAWIAGFKPRYLKALMSTFVAYVAANAIGFALHELGALENLPPSTQLIIGWGALSWSHVTFLRSDEQVRITPGKAMIVAICQIFGAAITFLMILPLLLLIKRALV